jgi:hypothetical protein
MMEEVGFEPTHVTSFEVRSVSNQVVSQEVFGTQPRERKIMHIGRQGATSPGSCSIQCYPRFLVGCLWRWRLGRPAISAFCRDLIKNNPYAFRISQDYTTRVKRKND